MQVGNYDKILSETDQYKEKRSEYLNNSTNWIEDAIIYNIIPDHFAYSWRNSDSSVDDSEENEFLKKESDSVSIPCTIQGIIDNMDYILKLGVNCICLNPFIFDKNKKEAYDYTHINEQLGENKDFTFLVNFCHNCNVKFILDGLFHEYNDENYSENKEDYRYHIRMKYYLDLCQQWIIEYGVDGIKIDNTVDMNQESFLIFCEAIKKCNENCWILINNKEDIIKENTYKEVDLIQNENTEDMLSEVRLENNHNKNEILKHDILKHDILPEDKLNDEENKKTRQHLDIVFNHRFYSACKNFFAMNYVNADQFSHCFNPTNIDGITDIPFPFINFLSDKSTSRFLVLCKKDLAKYKLSILYLMTSPGIPSILYGDENPVVGDKEEDCLQTMSFDEENELFIFFKAAIFLHKKLKGLRVGDYRTLVADKESNLLVFERYTEEECITVALNAGDKEVPLDLDIEDKMMIWNNGFGDMKMNAYGFVILREKRSINSGYGVL